MVIVLLSVFTFLKTYYCFYLTNEWRRQASGADGMEGLLKELHAPEADQKILQFPEQMSAGKNL